MKVSLCKKKEKLDFNVTLKGLEGDNCPPNFLEALKQKLLKSATWNFLTITNL